MQRLIPFQTALVFIDIQEKLVLAMPPSQMAELTRAAAVLLEAGQLLGAPTFATEQYPTGLGSTIPLLADRLEQMKIVRLPKMHFSACDDPGFARAFAKSSPRSAVVVGMETHVCVFQTVRELCARGVDVHVPMDGVASRRDDHRSLGLDLCRAAGATITTMETIVFDWLQKAGSEEFKRLSKLIR